MVMQKKPGTRVAPGDQQNTEKRDFVRLVYPADKRPVLTVAGNSFEVINICQTGLKFINHTGESLGSQVTGKVNFQNGGSIEVDGSIRWENDRETGLFVTRIPSFIIKQEIRAFIRHEANEETLSMNGASLETAKEEFHIEEE